MFCIKRLIIFTFFLMSWGTAFTQGRSNLWLLGYDSGSGAGWGGTRIDFSSGIPNVSYEFRTMNFTQCNASISGVQGNLLFYTNGVYVANANNDTMSNGGDLNPSSYTTSFSSIGLQIAQGDVIIPDPGDSSQYYLFHQTAYYLASIGDYKSLELYYSIIDMDLDGGLGEVVQKNVIIINDTLNIGCLTACKHANGRDWWIICHKGVGSGIYTLLVTPGGISGPYLQNAGSYIGPNDWTWQSCFSPDGKKYASFISTDTLDVFDFDRCSGILSNALSICINDSQYIRGVAFSPNSRYLYASSMYFLYQLDMFAPDIPLSRTTVAVYDGFYDSIPVLETAFYLAQLAYDSKIYLNSGNGTHYLHVINSPDKPGMLCNVTQHSLILPTYNRYSIPNYPNYFLGALGGSVCDSLPTFIHNKPNPDIFLKLFPNPVSNSFVIHYLLPPNNSGMVEIFNSLGEKIYDQTLPAGSTLQKIDEVDLSKGIYFLQITCGEKINAIRFVKE